MVSLRDYICPSKMISITIIPRVIYDNTTLANHIEIIDDLTQKLECPHL